jgi:hypothetical protein
MACVDGKNRVGRALKYDGALFYDVAWNMCNWPDRLETVWCDRAMFGGWGAMGYGVCDAGIAGRLRPLKSGQTRSDLPVWYEWTLFLYGGLMTIGAMCVVCDVVFQGGSKDV